MNTDRTTIFAWLWFITMILIIVLLLGCGCSTMCSSRTPTLSNTDAVKPIAKTKYLVGFGIKTGDYTDVGGDGNRPMSG